MSDNATDDDDVKIRISRASSPSLPSSYDKAREDSLEAPSAGSGHRKGRRGGGGGGGDGEGDGDDIELMPSATPRSTDGGNGKGGVGVRQPRKKRLRSLRPNEFEVPWDLKNYETPMEPSERMTIGQLLYGQRSPAEAMKAPKSAPLASVFETGFDESDSDSDSEASRSASRATGVRSRASTRRMSTTNHVHKMADAALTSDSVDEDENAEESLDKPSGASKSTDPEEKKLGWIFGVTLRCLFNIFGVIMFLRLPWVFGIAGAWYASLIVLICKGLTFTTAISLSAIVTNGRVKSGGTYYVISRALGPEFGGPIGVLFSVANSVAVSLYLVGFAETIRDLNSWNHFTFDVQVYALIALICVYLFCLVGVRLVSKIQAFIAFPILIIAVLSLIFGLVRWQIQGNNPSFAGFSSSTIEGNLGPKFDSPMQFFTALSIFFPGATGIMAGANVSGSLKDPARAIPKGTFSSIIISGVTYIVIGWLMVASVSSEELRGAPPDGDFLIMTRVAIEPAFIYVGIFASTLCQAITSFTSAPELLASVANDELYPFLNIFKRGNPIKRGYVATFVIAFLCILPGELDTIAPLITALFILAYSIINFACFMKSWTKVPGWRPSFKYYNKYLSLGGAIFAIVLMFILDSISAGIALGLALILGVAIILIKPDVNWGGAFKSIKYKNALKSMLALNKIRGVAKNYRLQVLVLCGPEHRHLEDFAEKFLRKGRGALILGNVIVQDLDDFKNSSAIEAAYEKKALWLETHVQHSKTPGFAECIISHNYRSGARALMQVSGLSRMRPEVLCVGFKENWEKKEKSEVTEYVNVLRDAFLLHYGVIMLRGFDDFDFAKERTGRIDVWWLIDDGGLTLLVPYIMTLTRQWKNSRIQVMDIITSRQISREKISMANLLKRFRINATTFEVHINADKGQKLHPSKDVEEMHSQLLPNYDDEAAAAADFDADAAGKRDARTNRHLFMADRIREVSNDADLVVVSIPIPDVGLDSQMYMSWIDCLSRDMPPTILVRGNQESVLTWEL